MKFFVRIRPVRIPISALPISDSTDSFHFESMVSHRHDAIVANSSVISPFSPSPCHSLERPLLCFCNSS